MAEILEAILASPAVRAFVADIALNVIASLMHRRATDPAFLAASDKAFDALAKAATPEEVAYAQNLLRVAMSSRS